MQEKPVFEVIDRSVWLLVTEVDGKLLIKAGGPLSTENVIDLYRALIRWVVQDAR
jgi:hypothetical protein